jgi:hypothetical protein
MSTNIKEFVCSSPTFNGYKCKIDLNYCDNIDDIIKIFKENLSQILILNNFENLLHKLNNSHINIINYQFNDILLSNNDEVYLILCN